MGRFVCLAVLLYFAETLPFTATAKAELPPLSITVNSTKALLTAVDRANRRGGNTVVIIEPGIYRLTTTLNITGSNIALQSSSKNPLDTILRGKGMKATSSVDNLLRVTGQHFRFSGLTGEAAPNHIIQIVGEANADYAIIENCILQDAYEQLLKVSHRYNGKTAADSGIVRHCTFGYTAGIGPQYYIGGIDLHLGGNWLIEANQFIGIASPDRRIAEHAIHLWYDSKSNQVINNIIINSDRGIGFGLGNKGNVAGLIQNNVIYHANNAHPFADAGITLESSPGTLVDSNWVIQYHDYPNAIEYRFAGTKEVNISNNRTNQRIRKRNRASADLVANKQVQDLTTAQKNAILKRFPPSYQQQVFVTFYPPAHK